MSCSFIPAYVSTLEFVIGDIAQISKFSQVGRDLMHFHCGLYNKPGALYGCQWLKNSISGIMPLNNIGDSYFSLVLLVSIEESH